MLVAGFSLLELELSSVDLSLPFGLLLPPSLDLESDLDAPPFAMLLA